MSEQGYIDPLAVIGRPPEHRDYRWLTAGGLVARGLPPSIADSAIIEALATVDAGLWRHTRVGERTLVMKKAHVSHDVVIGEECNIAPGAMIGGHVTIGDRVKVGLGAVIRPRITVGDDVVIGAGAVVVKDVPAGETWVGNPAQDIRRDRHVDPLWYEYGERHRLGCATNEGRECDCARLRVALSHLVGNLAHLAPPGACPGCDDVRELLAAAGWNASAR